MGAAEAATWILINNIWEFVGILPENISSASEYRVSHLLSLGEIPLAKKISGAAIWITALSAAACCAILFIFRDIIVAGVTQDETLDGMLVEIIPYIVICDPFISISTATSYLNRALAMYKRSTKLEFILTVAVTIPAGFISTYVLGYNIEGIAAASYIGYATKSFFSIVMFANSDWNRAAEKNRLMICEDEEEEEDEQDDDEEDQVSDYDEEEEESQKVKECNSYKSPIDKDRPHLKNLCQQTISDGNDSITIYVCVKQRSRLENVR